MRRTILFAFISILLVSTIAVFAVGPENALHKILKAYLSSQGIERRFTSTPRYNIAYFEGGENNKETVILLHGAGGNAITSWFRLLPTLVKKYHVIAPDLIFANLADYLKNNTYSISLDTFLVDDLVRAKRISQYHIAGLSVGGLIAMHVAQNNPEAVQSVMLITPAGHNLEQLTAVLTSKGDKAGEWFYKNLFQHPFPVPDFILAGQFKRINAIVQSIPNMLKSSGHELTPRYADIRQPTLILWGKDDKILPISFATPLVQALPQASLQTLTDCGHGVVWDQPTLLEQALLTFLNDQTTTTAQ